MARYSQIDSTTGPNPTLNLKDKYLRYRNVKYPNIPRSIDDIYIFTQSSDRYDTLSQIYYKDSSLWWIISTANYNTRQDSLTPPVGSQVRIPAPSRVNQIISNYEVLNS